MTDEPEQDPAPEPQEDPTPEPDPTVELPGANAPTVEAPGDEPAGGMEMESLAAFSYPGEKTVDRVRDGIDLDDVKDAGEWVWDKFKPKRREPAPEPIPIVIDIPMQEEETTIRSTSVARDDPPPPPPPEEPKRPARTGR